MHVCLSGLIFIYDWVCTSVHSLCEVSGVLSDSRVGVHLMLFVVEGSTYSMRRFRVWPRIALTYCGGGGPEKSFFFIHLHRAHVSTALFLPFLSVFSPRNCTCLWPEKGADGIRVFYPLALT